MPREEKVINGILHWRDNPLHNFTPYDYVQLTKKITDLRKTMRWLIDQLDSTLKVVKEHVEKDL